MSPEGRDPLYISAPELTPGPSSLEPPHSASRQTETRAEFESGLFKRLTYLTAFRLVIVTALLGATTWVSLKPVDEFAFPVSALLFGR